MDNPQQSVSGQRVVLAVLFILYCLASIRLYPGNWPRTVMETGSHVLSVLPFTVGFTVLFASVLGRLAGVRMSAVNLLRIFLMFSLLIELLYGIQHYLAQSGVGA